MADYILHLVIMLSIYAMLTYALNLLAGEGALLAFCIGALWGAGAYGAALTSMARSSAPYVQDLALAGSAGLELTLPMALLCGAAAGLVAGLLSLRFRNDAFVLATLAIQALAVGAAENLDHITRGTAGLYGIPEPMMFGQALGLPGLALVALGCVTGVVAAVLHLRHSRAGIELRALRDNEDAASALGVAPTRRYLTTFAVSGAIAGLAGGLYVGRAAYIDPASFALSESILVVTALLLGGRGTRFGPLLGAAALVLIPELLRFVGIGIDQATALRNALLSGLLILLVFHRPRGFVASRAP